MKYSAGKRPLSELNSAFLGAAFAYMDYEKRTHLFKTGDGETLFPAEIHVISTIKENEGIHITALAEKLEVTIGAVSQILMKLERKGLVIKERDVKNQSRFLLKVTPAGELIHKNHLKFHAEFDLMIAELVGSESDEIKTGIKDFLTALRVKTQEKT
jgi:DNA-binding MarR family transcriptional regulator